jgi:hypothetical protein
MPVKVVSERCARRDAVGAVTRQASQTHIGDAHRNLIVQQLALPGFKSKATEPDRVAAHQLQSQVRIQNI